MDPGDADSLQLKIIAVSVSLLIFYWLTASGACQTHLSWINAKTLSRLTHHGLIVKYLYSCKWFWYWLLYCVALLILNISCHQRHVIFNSPFTFFFSEVSVMTWFCHLNTLNTYCSATYTRNCHVAPETKPVFYKLSMFVWERWGSM